jgi:hypothetical protein
MNPNQRKNEETRLQSEIEEDLQVHLAIEEELEFLLKEEYNSV